MACSLLSALAVQTTGLQVMADQWRSRTNTAQGVSSDPAIARRVAAGKAVPLNARVVRSADKSVDSAKSEIRQTSGIQDGLSVRPASNQMLIPQAGDSLDSDRTVGTSLPSVKAAVNTAPQTAESIAAQTKPSLQQAISRQPAGIPSGAYTWKDSYQQRMDHVVSDQAVVGQREDQGAGVVEWWHENSVVHQMNNRHLVQAVVVQPQKIRQFVADHTLPPQIEPEQAFYDSNPRYIELGPVRPVSSQQTSEDPDSQIARLTRDITKIQPTLSYALEGIREDQLPDDFFERMDNGAYVSRSNAPTVLQWAPTNLYHNPLYFEDPALERYGHTYHPLIQPFASSGRFATQLVGLPYQMVLHPVHSKEYALGYYRPGDYAPKKLYQIPFNEEASLMQIAVVAGLILIFP